MIEAKVGDEVAVDGPRTGDLRREGEILEILSTGGVVHYRVRWDDGNETIFYPASTATSSASRSSTRRCVRPASVDATRWPAAGR